MTPNTFALSSAVDKALFTFSFLFHPHIYPEAHIGIPFNGQVQDTRGHQRTSRELEPRTSASDSRPRATFTWIWPCLWNPVSTLVCSSPVGWYLSVRGQWRDDVWEGDLRRPGIQMEAESQAVAFFLAFKKVWQRQLSFQASGVWSLIPQSNTLVFLTRGLVIVESIWNSTVIFISLQLLGQRKNTFSLKEMK